MAIYTKTGDKGTTSLANGERVSKTDARLEAYGTVDELNSWVGLLRAGIQSTDRFADRIQTELVWVQNKLFNLGAALSCAPGEWITASDVQQLEAWIDQMQVELPQPRAFVLPAGGEAVARCQVCRTVCRRAERRMLEIGNEQGETEGVELQFVNRLSDYLFVLARFIGYKLDEIEQIWQK
jgi:cob(I)alamin adenosyltransferase